MKTFATLAALSSVSALFQWNSQVVKEEVKASELTWTQNLATSSQLQTGYKVTNYSPCPTASQGSGWCSWSGWSAAKYECGKLVMSRKRKCVVYSNTGKAELGIPGAEPCFGDECQKKEVDSEKIVSGNTDYCPYWSGWEPWECPNCQTCRKQCGTAGSGNCKRVRVCNDVENPNSPQCSGSAVESMPAALNTIQDSPQCTSTTVSDWSLCDCRTRTRTRTHTTHCVIDGQLQRNCVISTRPETEPCNDCYKCKQSCQKHTPQPEACLETTTSQTCVFERIHCGPNDFSCQRSDSVVCGATTTVKVGPPHPPTEAYCANWKPFLSFDNVPCVCTDGTQNCLCGKGGTKTTNDRHFCLDQQHDKRYFSETTCTASKTERCGEEVVCQKSYGCFNDLNDIINGVYPIPYDQCGQYRCVEKCACPTVPNTPKYVEIIPCNPPVEPTPPGGKPPCLREPLKEWEARRTECGCNAQTFTIYYENTCDNMELTGKYSRSETVPCPPHTERLTSIQKGQSHYKRTLIVKHCSPWLNATVIAQVNSNTFVGYLVTPPMCDLGCLCEKNEKFHDWSVKHFGTYAQNGDQCSIRQDGRVYIEERNLQQVCYGPEQCGQCSGTCTMPSESMFNSNCPKPYGYTQGPAPSQRCASVDYCGKAPAQERQIPCGQEACCVPCGEVCETCPPVMCPSDGVPMAECRISNTCGVQVQVYEKPCGEPADCPPFGEWGPWGQCAWIEDKIEPSVDLISQGTCVCGGYRERTRSHPCMEDVINNKCGIVGRDALTEIDSFSQRHHSEYCYNLERETCVINHREEQEITNLCALEGNMCAQRICTWTSAYIVCEGVRKAITEKTCRDTTPVPCCAQWEQNTECKRVGADIYKEGKTYDYYYNLPYPFQTTIQAPHRCSLCAVAEVTTSTCVAGVGFCQAELNLAIYNKQEEIREPSEYGDCGHLFDRECIDKTRNPHFKELDTCCQTNFNTDSVFLYEGECLQVNETEYNNLIKAKPLNDCVGFHNSQFGDPTAYMAPYDKCIPQGICYVYCNADCFGQERFLRRCSLDEWNFNACTAHPYGEWQVVSGAQVAQQTELYGAPEFQPIATGNGVVTVPDTNGLCDKFFGNNNGCGGYLQRFHDCDCPVQQIKCPDRPCQKQMPTQPLTCFTNPSECDRYVDGACIIERQEILVSGCQASCSLEMYVATIPPCQKCVPRFEESCPLIDGCVCPGADGSIFTQTTISWEVIDVPTGRVTGAICGNATRTDEYVYPEALKQYMIREARNEISFSRTPYVGPPKEKVACSTRPQATWTGSGDCSNRKCERFGLNRWSSEGNYQYSGNLCARIVSPPARQELQCNGVTMPSYQCGAVVKDIPCDVEEIYAPRVVVEETPWNNGDECNGCCTTQIRKCVDRLGNLAPFSSNPSTDPMCEKCGCGCCQASTDKSNIIREDFGIEEVLVGRSQVIVENKQMNRTTGRQCANGKRLPAHCTTPQEVTCREDICSTRCFQQGHVCGKQGYNGNIGSCFISKGSEIRPVAPPTQTEFRYITPVPEGLPANWICDRESQAQVLVNECSCDDNRIIPGKMISSYIKTVESDIEIFVPSGPEFYGIKPECLSGARRMITTIRYCPLPNGQILEHIISREQKIERTNQIKTNIKWTPWSSCDKQCFECGNEGQQTKFSYDDCKIQQIAIQTEVRPCGCPTSRWGEWKLVAECEPCGKQQRTYTRQCVAPSCQVYAYGSQANCGGQCNQCIGESTKTEFVDCRPPPAKDCQIVKKCDSQFKTDTLADGTRTQLRTCSDECGNSIKSRIIKCNGNTPSYTPSYTPTYNKPTIEYNYNQQQVITYGNPQPMVVSEETETQTSWSSSMQFFP